MERKSRSSRDANEELALWKQICHMLLKLEGIQKDEESILNSINKIQLSVNAEQGTAHNLFFLSFFLLITGCLGITSLLHQKLKDAYRRGIELSSNEYK